MTGAPSSTHPLHALGPDSGCRFLRAIKRMPETLRGNFEKASHSKLGLGERTSVPNWREPFPILSVISGSQYDFFSNIDTGFCFPAGICRDFASFGDLPSQQAVGELPSITFPSYRAYAAHWHSPVGHMAALLWPRLQGSATSVTTGTPESGLSALQSHPGR